MKLIKYIQPVVIVGLVIALFLQYQQVQEMSMNLRSAEEEVASEKERAERLSELAQRNAAEAHIAAAEAEKQRQECEELLKACSGNQ